METWLIGKCGNSMMETDRIPAVMEMVLEI